MKITCLLFASIAILVTIVPLRAQCNSYQCPPCAKTGDGGPMIGHGTAPDGSSRRIYNVFIDSSWGTPINPTILGATNQAIDAWNKATDPSCNGSPGSQTAYYFKLNQEGGYSAADVVIYSGTPFEACAEEVNGPLGSPVAPRTITIRPVVAYLTQDQAAIVIEHELGHVINLKEAGQGTICLRILGSCENAPLTTCAPDYARVISPQDIGQSDRNLTYQSTCGGQFQSQNQIPTDSCPSDNGCNGYDINGYPFFNPDFCQYDGGCSDGFQQGGDGVPGNCCGYASSPIVIDVASDGFELTDAKDGVMFDLTNSGKKQLFSWTAAGVQNGWLALDRNGDGQIDSGAELFGNVTPQPASSHPNGYIALAVYDRPENGGNGNGVIDPGDQIFGSLLIWIDNNHNGISEPSELHHLAELGIETIGLDYKESRWTDQYGNVFRYKGSVKIANKPGGHWTYDVFLQMAH